MSKNFVQNGANMEGLGCHIGTTWRGFGGRFCRYIVGLGDSWAPFFSQARLGQRLGRVWDDFTSQ